MLHDQGQELVVEAHAGTEIAGEGELEIALRRVRHIADREAVLMGELRQEIEAEGMLVLGGRFVDIGAGVERHSPDESLDALLLLLAKGPAGPLGEGRQQAGERPHEDEALGAGS